MRTIRMSSNRPETELAAPGDKPITPERSPTLPRFVRLRNAPAYLQYFEREEVIKVTD